MEIFILLVVLATLLVVTHFIAAYAERKGRSYLGFYILSFLCFPLGLIAAVLASPNQENIAVSSDLVKCGFCAEYIKREAKICRFCQRERTPDLNSASIHQVSQETDDVEHEDAMPLTMRIYGFVGILIIFVLILVVAAHKH